MEYINYMNLVLSFIVGMLGVAVGYGALKNEVKHNTLRIKELDKWRHLIEGNPNGEPAYIKRGECLLRQQEIDKKMNEIKNECERQAKAIIGLRNYARYMLTKDGLTLDEVDKIINGV